jgi:MFS family permease
MSMANRQTVESEVRVLPSTIVAAAAVTATDGFDAFSLSLTAPHIGSDLHIQAAAFGSIFASNMGGMILGALLGGASADRLGRVRVLLFALAVFALAALAMPWMGSVREIIVNRLCSGIGLGAAAPIAVALLSRTNTKPPSQLVLSLVWSGIGVGGVLAAIFNYVVVTPYGWQSMFIAGGLLPLVPAVLSYVVFRKRDSQVPGNGAGGRPRLGDLFAPGWAARTIAIGIMFFFGYVTTSVIVFWLPTILNHRHASTGMISVTFGALNVGGFFGTLALGWLSTRPAFVWTLPAGWGIAGLCALCAALPMLHAEPMALLATVAASVAAGSQALSVAAANQLHRARALESTSVGFAASLGRVGQFAALSLTGVVLGWGAPETSLFAFAGASAVIAAMIAVFVARPLGSAAQAKGVIGSARPNSARP